MTVRVFRGWRNFCYNITNLLWIVIILVNLRPSHQKGLKCIWSLNSTIYPIKWSNALINMIYDKGRLLWYHNDHYIILSPPLYNFICLTISQKRTIFHLGILKLFQNYFDSYIDASLDKALDSLDMNDCKDIRENQLNIQASEMIRKAHVIGKLCGLISSTWCPCMQKTTELIPSFQ